MNTQLVNSLVEVILSLPVAERELLEQKLSESQHFPRLDLANLQDEPFVGMWKDREEMADSTAWVQTTREQQWINRNVSADSG